MDLVPLKKHGLTRAQFEQLPHFSRCHHSTASERRAEKRAVFPESH
jgi:hypothetical protein